MSTRRWAFALAIGATTTALCLSVLAGWQRGGTLPERLIWIAIGTVLVTSAHLLPALIREMPFVIRGVGSLLWGTSLVMACYGHAVFFAFAQQHAGEQRASTVQAIPAPSPARSLTVVMAERAAVTAQLAAANARYCAGNCITLESRRETLTAKVAALNAEADEVRRQQAATDRVVARQDSLLADPVTSRLAALLGVTTARADLLSGLMFAAVLEGVACLLWVVTLRSPLPKPASVVTGIAPSAVTMTADVTQPEVIPITDVTDATQQPVTPVTASHDDETVSRNSVTPRHDSTTSSHAPRDDPIELLPATVPIDDHLSRLIRDVEAGLVRPTVADIRRHLGCSQSRATRLRRQLAELATAA
ncbi:hypothetical protein [Burkholderia thailandensis]|uniref:hypothetical protein n=1 Tax=Burkholderia thailandensis TaxID=57975 RepID=UPI0001B4154B|nr:hypothetical protein [Burkholderia thailandensis]AHI72624.1 putative membrane protein [Burkholderia thailandensis 2002721723]AIP23973.1 hypothetical protein DR63_3052 [Burkholderia thailandensis E264]AJX99563.1 hypothetical protein BG87_2623 [Burkholderia thailandensis 2002721643]MCS3399549.1 hypothetical protein [Burkholderia thailandensis]MCS6509273.1 hypothetical protein [Burkholderia thailandensis]